MEYIKSVETLNFRIIFESSEHDKIAPDPKVSVSCKVYGKSDDGLRFCQSKDALELVTKPYLAAKGLPGIIRAYELCLPMARQCGYLNQAEKVPTLPVTPSSEPVRPVISPAPSYRSQAPDLASPPIPPIAAVPPASVQSVQSTPQKVETPQPIETPKSVEMKRSNKI